MLRSSHRMRFVKKLFLKISQNSLETPMSKSLFNKVAYFRPATLLKRGSCEFVIYHLRWLLLNASLHYNAVSVEHRKALKEGKTLV